MRLSRFFFIFSLFLTTSAFADPTGKDQVFILSGGGSPAGNHYSQYLQTKLLTDELRVIIGEDQVDVRFGHGNDGSTPALHDVHRAVTREDGRSYHVMVPGHIAGNGPATKAEVLQYFANTANSTVGADDTFFLFVTDHGMPNQDNDDYSNNCVDLWGFDAETLSSVPFADRCLSVNELRDLIKTYVPAQKTVFAMSQCFSGGFHQMSVTKANGYPTADTALCGFTAVTEDTTASGCTPDVDGPGYKGYERYLAQQLTGRDVVSGNPMPYTRKQTLKEAHLAAALEDTAKDIPFSTSDYYLTEWARTIEAEGFTPRAGNYDADEVVAVYTSALDATSESHSTLRFARNLRSSIVARQEYLAGTAELLSTYDPEIAAVVTAPMATLTAYLNDLETRRAELVTEASTASQQAFYIWYYHAFQPWKNALVADELDYLSTLQRDSFELGFLAPVENAGGYVSSAAIYRLAVWSAEDQSTADELSSYLAIRDELRYDWLAGNISEESAAQIERVKQLEDASSAKWEEASKLEERYDQLRRIVFTRKQIAAAIAIDLMGDQTALSELSGLEGCEATPFR